MAQDVRQYKSKEQDGQGNEIILRDQQLVEQTSQTTMASGEYFEIVDVDGRMAKIPKDNMIGVVREALGTLLNSLTDQTTVTKALTLNGDTLGASTADTLASVLGVNLRNITMIRYQTGGSAFWNAICGSSYAGTIYFGYRNSAEDPGPIISFGTADYTFQIWCSYLGGLIKTRVYYADNAQWSGWQNYQ